MVTGAFRGHLLPRAPARPPLRRGLDGGTRLRIPRQEPPGIPALPGQRAADTVLLKPPPGAGSAGCSLGGQRWRSLGGPVCCVHEESFLEVLLSPFLQLSHSFSTHQNQ